MWLTHGWPVKVAYGFVTLTFATTVAFVHPKPDVRTETVQVPGQVIVLPPPPPPPPRIIRRRVEVPILVPGPVRTVVETVEVPGPTRTITVPVPMPGPTRTITVVRPSPPPTTPPTTVPPPPKHALGHGRGHKPIR